MLNIYQTCPTGGNGKILLLRMDELATIRIHTYSVRLNVIHTPNVLFLDEAGLVSKNLLSVISMILRRIRNDAIIFGGVLIICTIDHNQLPLVLEKLFLISSHILSFFQMVRLGNSVCANTESLFQ